MNDLFYKRIKDYLSDDDYNHFISSLDDGNIRAIRQNSNYYDGDIRNVLDFSVSPIPELDYAYKMLDDIKLGFNCFHHAGLFYAQDPGAMIPPLVLNTDKKINYILDLCASPGGKTIELANKYKDAIIISNEIDYKRAQILYSNVERMGLRNVIVTNNSPEVFKHNFQGFFDLILVDAPCSGEGMIRKYKDEVEKNWSIENINLCAKRDKEILKDIAKLLTKDGYLIYSTCTFAKEENEDIVSYLQKEESLTSIDIDPKYKGILYPGLIKNTYRIYPFLNFGEGQFVSLLQNKNDYPRYAKFLKNKTNIPLFNQFVKDNMKDVSIDPLIFKDYVYENISNLDLSNFNVMLYGPKLGYISKGIFRPDHYFFKSYFNHFKNSLNLDKIDKRIDDYLKGLQITADVNDSYGVLSVSNIPLGGFKAKNGVLNNLYPKALRNF